MKHIGWFRRKSGKGCCKGSGTRKPLSDCLAGEKGVVLSNTDLRITEMGFSHGRRFEVVRNDDGDDSLIVEAGDARFAIPREAASQMIICIGGEGHHHRRGRGHRQCSET
ncbi:MAG: ferrous iron transport protein A [Verrucomicrobia bacterium]|nr:ferrous iron transport protein A [Verrucomicrobiota bacterium]